ncbi:MAG: hypothetical protein DMF59_07895 [Acidobacteria bacterium]|nr:MAG: hypothetical protein DMF59_07895 [Acidobacteriota bacterium]
MLGGRTRHPNIPSSQLGRAAVLALLFLSFPAFAAERIIVVTVTEGFRHDSIPTAERVIADIAPRLGFEINFVRDESELAIGLSPAALQSAKAVMFVNTTGDLPVPLRESLLAWIANGGSFIGVHSASDTWHEWPAYIEMLGGEFDHHPDQTANHLCRQRHKSRDRIPRAVARFVRGVLHLQELRSQPRDDAALVAYESRRRRRRIFSAGLDSRLRSGPRLLHRPRPPHRCLDHGMVSETHRGRDRVGPAPRSRAATTRGRQAVTLFGRDW